MNKLPKWQYATAWNRIITKDKNGLQVVVMDGIEHKRGLAIVKKANRFIRIKNIMLKGGYA
jgi:hypothetical protein